MKGLIIQTKKIEKKVDYHFNFQHKTSSLDYIFLENIIKHMDKKKKKPNSIF